MQNSKVQSTSQPIFVFGHQSPDVDSMGSAIVWAWYLNTVKNTPAQPMILGPVNNEAQFVAKHWGCEMPEIMADIEAGQPCVIVDTNNAAELPENINNADIRAIIDHHLLAGNLRTVAPIDITIRPLACTATLMYELMGDDASRMPDQIKGVMLSCILSDTLAFTSPTTTPVDQALAQKLASELNISIDDLSGAMFAAKSDISAFSDTELLRMDSKKYGLGDHQLRISVLETAAPASVMEREAGLIAAMDMVQSEDQVDAIMLFVIDIIQQSATLLVPNELTKTIAQASFGAAISNDKMHLPGIVSRKKQIIPSLKL